MAKLKRSLKACPFCGARAAVAYQSPPPLEISVFTVFCVDCGAITDPPYNTAKEARKAWNDRRGIIGGEQNA